MHRRNCDSAHVDAKIALRRTRAMADVFLIFSRLIEKCVDFGYFERILNVDYRSSMECPINIVKFPKNENKNKNGFSDFLNYYDIRQNVIDLKNFLTNIWKVEKWP